MPERRPARPPPGIHLSLPHSKDARMTVYSAGLPAELVLFSGLGEAEG